MTGRLDGTICVVVGAGQQPGPTIGNGRATSLRFAEEGANLLLVDRDADAVARTRDDVARTGATVAAETLVVDITADDAPDTIVRTAIDTFGRLDVLHNNVGIGGGGGPVELSEEHWDKVIDTNLKSMFLTCKYVLPYMEKQGSGAIVNVSSMAAVRFAPYPMLAYSSSKAGLNAFTRSVAMQYAQQGIRSNCIMPGLINTPMAIEGLSKRLGIEKEDLIRMRDDAVPMRHMGEAWDIAYTALFLASDEAKYITGVVIAVDGGLSCKG